MQYARNQTVVFARNETYFLIFYYEIKSRVFFSHDISA